MKANNLCELCFCRTSRRIRTIDYTGKAPRCRIEIGLSSGVCRSCATVLLQRVAVDFDAYVARLNNKVASIATEKRGAA